MAAPVIQFKRGLLANLPGLQAGEPGFTTDSYDLYVGLTSETATNKIIGSHRFWTNSTATTGSGVNLVEATNNGTDFITLKAPNTLSGIVTYTFPGTDGSNGQALVTNGSGTLSFASVTTSAGTLTGAGAGITAFLVTPSSANLASAVTDETGTGSLVFANSPTLVSPALGTPSSGTLTNCTGYTVGNISGLGANVATFLATPTSSNLASAISDETGSGSLVFANTPTFTGGINASEGADLGRLRVTGIATHGQTTTIGLSNAGVSTLGNATASTLVVSGFSTFSGGLSVTSGGANVTGVVTATTFSGNLAVGNITGLGANVATFLATPSSANLASAVTDETGTGALVFANSPTLITPTLGAASATSLTVSNDVTITGNLFVNGSTTQVNTTTTTIEDQLLDLGIVDGAVPSSDLNKDIGVLFNYYTTSAKKAALFWDDSVSRVVAAADVSESAGVLTINTYADFEAKSLYINGCTGQSEQVIACSGSKVIIQNATIDGGSF